MYTSNDKSLRCCLLLVRRHGLMIKARGVGGGKCHKQCLRSPNCDINLPHGACCLHQKNDRYKLYFLSTTVCMYAYTSSSVLYSKETAKLSPVEVCDCYPTAGSILYFMLTEFPRAIMPDQPFKADSGWVNHALA